MEASQHSTVQSFLVHQWREHPLSYHGSEGVTGWEAMVQSTGGDKRLGRKALQGKYCYVVAGIHYIRFREGGREGEREREREIKVEIEREGEREVIYM